MPNARCWRTCSIAPWQAMLRFERVQEERNEEICREGNFTLFNYGIPIDETADF